MFLGKMSKFCAWIILDNNVRVLPKINIFKSRDY